MKKEPSKKKKLKVKAPNANEIKPVEDEKPFDFGGLPTRDLKKNLGCG